VLKEREKDPGCVIERYEERNIISGSCGRQPEVEYDARAGCEAIGAERCVNVKDLCVKEVGGVGSWSTTILRYLKKKAWVDQRQ
jgi:hypothetical protein